MPAIGRATTWSDEEDSQLRDLIFSHGCKNWSHIASKMPSKSGKQCRRRWNNHLNVTLKKGSWSPEEDRILLEGHTKLGNQWTAIAKLVTGRARADSAEAVAIAPSTHSGFSPWSAKGALQGLRALARLDHALCRSKRSSLTSRVATSRVATLFVMVSLTTMQVWPEDEISDAVFVLGAAQSRGAVPHEE
ncbi:hypothetical protein CYMTET_2959 [Cymbomonas tetramitiformis]|uniref:Uncharacterized protein n=1 Tax=Cymbomonas tetramitiformis TaxID=36881 RepID=A0AAE0H4A2_9CHLO|nr:hypothetical protein CYMTET_2959 [Cymbomonas tetramitiformis]